jgi:hypothetical protein
MSPPSAPTTDRRRSRRRKPSQLVYLEFGKENGGMVKDVSEGGMRFYLINPVAAGQRFHFAVNLDAKRCVEGQALMVWTDAGGKSGGMSFVEISEESRETLRAWLAEIDSLLSATPALSVHAAAPSIAPVPIASIPVAPHAAPTAPTVPAPVAPVLAAPHIAMPTPVMPRAIASVPEAVGPVAAAPAAPALATTSAAPHVFTPALAVERPTASAPAAAEPVAARVPARTTAELPVEVAPHSPTKSSPEIPIESPETSRPVTREDWIRAARENLVPGDRSGRLAATVATEPAAAPSLMERLLPASPAAPPAMRTVETKRAEEMAERVDPLREFLRHRIANSEFAHTPVDAITPTEEDDAISDEPVRSGWPLSRVAMLLALAAICGAAAAFAAIAYRQTVGESIIKLGEEISGEQRANGAGDASPPSATPPGAENPQTTKPAPDTARPADKGPSATQPANPAPPSPITQVRPQTLQQSPNPEAELAAGREIVPGPRKHLPEDVAALWVAVENGDANAEVRLANRYISGDGVAKNCDQARVLLQAAGKRGNELATKRLTELSQVGCQ